MSNPSSDSYRNPLRYQGQDYSFAPRYYRPRDPLSPTNASADIKPKENQGYYPLASFWSNSKNGNLWVLTEIVNNLANWVLIGTSGGNLLTLSDNGDGLSPGTKVFPDVLGNIQLTGEVVAQNSVFNTIVSYPASNQININPMSTARWIVDQNGTATNRQNGTHTTITSAILSATSGDTIFIMPGFYVEDVSLKPGVNLCAYTCDSYTPTVTIAGFTNLTSSGTVSISGIRLTTNGNYCLAVTGSEASIINCINCDILGTLNSCILNSSTSSSSVIYLYNCIGDQLAAGHNLYLNSGSGSIIFNYCIFNNTSANTSPGVCSNGIVNYSYSNFSQAILFSGTGAGKIDFCDINCATINQIAVETTGTGTSTLTYSKVSSGTNFGISVGVGTTLNVRNCQVDSTHAAAIAISGGGTLNYSPILFTNSAYLINTTVQVPYNFGPIIQLPPVSGLLTAQIMSGNGDPNGVVTAPVSSLSFPSFFVINPPVYF